MVPIKILIIVTSHAQMGSTTNKAGLWLETLAVPYYLFKEAGLLITVASPKGGPVPLDPKSESIIVSTSTIRRFQKDPETISLLEHAIPLSTQIAGDFDLVFLPGGHGPMWDFPCNTHLKDLIEDFSRQNKLIGAVSHGVASLVTPLNGLGEPLMKGRQLTAFSNSEEEVCGLTGVVPFALESALVSLGASYSKGANFESHTVTDGNIITGQNAASAKEVARKLLLCLKGMPKRAEALVFP
jgi:putative intracellular protease/amidase